MLHFQQHVVSRCADGLLPLQLNRGVNNWLKYQTPRLLSHVLQSKFVYKIHLRKPCFGFRIHPQKDLLNLVIDTQKNHVNPYTTHDHPILLHFKKLTTVAELEPEQGLSQFHI